MHPLFFRIRRLFWYVLAWIMLGAVLAWMLVDMQLADWSGALLFALPAAPLYGLILSSAYYVSRSLPFRQRNVLNVLMVFCGSSLLSSLAWLWLCFLWSQIIADLGLVAALQLGHQFAVLGFIGGVLLYWVSLLAYDLLNAFEDVRLAERRQSASQLMVRDAELQLLRNQINPHFLFNSLNSISALTSIDAAAARGMAIELGSFYRKTLAISERQYISLGEEIALCEHFMAIEKMRFGDKLQARWSIDAAAMAVQVPAMFMQPLLENAIKHGICNLDEGGTIDVHAVVRNAALHISIDNPVDNEPSLAKGTATGLKNLKSRVENLYQEQASVRWQKRDGHFIVELILPIKGAIAGEYK